MKRLLQKQRKCPGALLLTLALTLAAFAARADRLTAVRTYDTSAVRLGTRTAPDGTEFRTVDWGDMHPAAEVGSPELPVEHFRFLVPVYSNNFRATVVSATGASALPLGSRVLPAQIPQKADGSPAPEFTYPKAAAYVRTLAPEAWVVDDGFIDGCNHVVTVAVRPLAYDDASVSASAYGSVTVRLDYDLCGEDGLTGSKPIFPPHASEYVRIEDLVVNTANVAQFAPQRSSSTGTGGYTNWYYIIVPDNLKDAVDDLAVWKRQKGYNVVVKTIEDICATPRYVVGGHCSYRNGQTEELVDSAASLRAYLHDEFEDNGAFFCLLVGNSKTSMPIRKGSWGGKGNFAKYKNNNGEHAVPSDAYFSDLDQVWDLKKEFEGAVYTTYCEDLSYNPEIYVGRLLCNKPNEIDNYTQKLILYESNPGYGDNEYLNNSFFFESQDGFMNHSIDIRESVKDVFNIELVQDDGNNTYPTGQYVISKMRKVGLSSWHAHGNPYGLACSNNGSGKDRKYITSIDDICDKNTTPLAGNLYIPDDFTQEDKNGLDNLNNKLSPSIAYSCSCDNTPFDCLEWTGNWLPNSRFVFDAYNMGESFTVAGDYGGPAFLGYTRASLFCSKRLENCFMAMIMDFPKVGVCEALSKYSYRGIRNEYLSNAHNLIGEPEFEMWLGKPDTLDFNYTYSGNGINIIWPVSQDVLVNVFDGTGAVISAVPRGRPVRGFASELTNGDFAISAWETGKLPIINYFGQNATLAGVKKSYIVRDAILGSSWEDTVTSKFKVALQAVLSVRAIDSITSTELFEVEDGGTAELKCDKHVNLEGSTVKSGGTLTVEGETVTLGPGFKVEKDGSLIVKTNK